VEELAELLRERLVAEAVELRLVVDVLRDLTKGPSTSLGGEPVHAHQLPGLSREPRQPVEGLPVDPTGGPQPLPALEPVGRDLRVLAPAPIDDAGGEERPIEEDLGAQHRRAGDVAVEREMSGAAVHRLGGDVVPALRIAGAVLNRAGVELNDPAPAGVEATPFELLRGERFVADAVQLRGRRRVRVGGLGPGGCRRRLAAVTAGAEEQGEEDCGTP
jgi:hypothetical protein